MKSMNFAFKRVLDGEVSGGYSTQVNMIDFVLNMSNFVLQMMDSVLNILDYRQTCI